MQQLDQKTESMYCEVDAGQFKHALARVSRAVATRSTKPVLHNVLLKVADGRLELTCTDLEIYAIESIPVYSSCEGSFHLPAKLLKSCLIGTDGELRIGKEDDQAIINCGDRIFRFQLSGNDYPSIKDKEFSKLTHFELPDFLEKLSFVMPAMYLGGDRAALNGVFIGKDDMVATDTHILHILKHGWDFNRQNVIIPASLCRMASSLFRNNSSSPITIAVKNQEGIGTEPLIYLKQDDLMLIGLGLSGEEGKYPSYQKILGVHESHAAWEVESAPLLMSLHSLLLIAREDGRRVSFDIPAQPGHTLHLQADAYNIGNVNDKLNINMLHRDNQDINFCLSAEYLIDILRAMDEYTIQISFNHPLEYLEITPKGKDWPKAIIMPMQNHRS